MGGSIGGTMENTNTMLRSRRMISAIRATMPFERRHFRNGERTLQVRCAGVDSGLTGLMGYATMIGAAEKATFLCIPEGKERLYQKTFFQIFFFFSSWVLRLNLIVNRERGREGEEG